MVQTTTSVPLMVQQLSRRTKERHTNNHVEESPSLLAIILDTNPHAWALLKPTLPLSKAIANIIVFINAHLAFNNANQVAVIASHAHRAVCLYPRPAKAASAQDEDVDMI